MEEEKLVDLNMKRVLTLLYIALSALIDLKEELNYLKKEDKIEMTLYYPLIFGINISISTLYDIENIIYNTYTY
jgi:hypothetical protein